MCFSTLLSIKCFCFFHVLAIPGSGMHLLVPSFVFFFFSPDILKSLNIARALDPRRREVKFTNFTSSNQICPVLHILCMLWGKGGLKLSSSLNKKESNHCLWLTYRAALMVSRTSSYRWLNRNLRKRSSVRRWDEVELQLSGEPVGVHMKMLLWCTRGKKAEECVLWWRGGEMPKWNQKSSVHQLLHSGDGDLCVDLNTRSFTWSANNWILCSSNSNM